MERNGTERNGTDYNGTEWDPRRRARRLAPSRWAARCGRVGVRRGGGVGVAARSRSGDPRAEAAARPPKRTDAERRRASWRAAHGAPSFELGASLKRNRTTNEKRRTPSRERRGAGSFASVRRSNRAETQWRVLPRGVMGRGDDARVRRARRRRRRPHRLRLGRRRGRRRRRRGRRRRRRRGPPGAARRRRRRVAVVMTTATARARARGVDAFGVRGTGPLILQLVHMHPMDARSNPARRRRRRRRRRRVGFG